MRESDSEGERSQHVLNLVVGELVLAARRVARDQQTRRHITLLEAKRPNIPHSWRPGLVFKAHRLVYHSTLGSRVMKKKRRRRYSAPRGAKSRPSLSLTLSLTLALSHTLAHTLARSRCALQHLSRRTLFAGRPTTPRCCGQDKPKKGPFVDYVKDFFSPCVQGYVRMQMLYRLDRTSSEAGPIYPQAGLSIRFRGNSECFKSPRPESGFGFR